MISSRESRSLVTIAMALLTAACATSQPGTAGANTGDVSSGPRIVQPGAPGQAATTFSAEEIEDVEGVSYTEADVRFMHGMIPHHEQALVMTELVRRYATTDAVRQMALRMEISQRDEIALMETWLRNHGEPTRMPGLGNGMHMMPGMLTPDQMEELRNARGVRFDQLFLEYMIQHHLGAIDMVATLFATPGAAQESTVFKFAEDVDADQTMEIERMQRVLESIR
ncbi:MAG: DUF305 domain-containing protein [Acidimicrobiia bacterium]|nr:DUF305 domain-containing protein [Acidimicrobiia bacterium]